ncbi:hypothetical protein KIN20_027705 [Parelaphostrongylus tenuis]|uniref:Uncharacterized protein n=1 Tax=Parelaphostrongylus tenuis TaxID=148309 RepID=A0AAD5QZU8_PARTN|nr:hypothetical protein KIN20_027705 [Parelaphostrongylus tenuis]
MLIERNQSRKLELVMPAFFQVPVTVSDSCETMEATTFHRGADYDKSYLNSNLRNLYMPITKRLLVANIAESDIIGVSRTVEKND